jgi:WhiB family redox-sensing transcriptional regulator
MATEPKTDARYDSPDWMHSSEAKCWGLTEFFYPDRSNAEVMAAKNACNGNDGRPPCAHRKQCLEWAIDHQELYGVWGGTSERDRRKIRKARRISKNTNVYTFEDIAFPGVMHVKRQRFLFVKRRR